MSTVARTRSTSSTDRNRELRGDAPQPAPTDDGEKLATLDRGPDKELRVRWRQFNGHVFLDIREWSRREAGADWWPTKGKGVTLKARELPDVIEALEAARRLS